MGELRVVPDRWELAEADPGVATPGALEALQPAWLTARVPGTVADALSAAGRWTSGEPLDVDGRDWWWRVRVRLPDPAGPWTLHLGGVATIGDVFWNGELLLHLEGMFRSHRVALHDAGGDNELVVCCRALGPRLAERRPRPRWRTRLVQHQQLRWFRTTLLGRMPAWSPGPAAAGLWRSVELVRGGAVELLDRWVTTDVDGSDGTVDVRLRLRGDVPGPVTLSCGGASTALQVQRDGDDTIAAGGLAVRDVERWWPAGLGAQARYELVLSAGGHQVPLGRVGFRSLTIDRAGGGFRVVVNGVAVFCRGAVWVPPDPVGLHPPAAEVRGLLRHFRDAGATMVRLAGTMVYEDETFWDACDELGILVWQDAMLANMDPPDAPEFTAELHAEWTEQLRRLQGRPSVAVLCGGSEVEQQAAMFGLPEERRRMPAIDVLLPGIARDELPGVPWVANSPTGGTLPFHPGAGIAHYYGVGAYLRPLGDARTAGVRFAAECLAFANPPDPRTVDEVFDGPSGAGHHPNWKAAVPRDAGTGWDFEDVRDHYVGRRFGLDPMRLRYADPARYLDLGRAVTHDLIAEVLTEWRRPGSTCGGGIVLMLRDLLPGAGWGLVDALGRPKAAWFGFAAAAAPVALLATDEGLNGWHLHVVNDRPDPFSGRVLVETFAQGEVRTATGEGRIEVAGHGGVTIPADGLLEGFRDLTWAYRFGPPAHDVVAATLCTDDDEPVGWATLLPVSLDRAVEPCVGLDVALSDAPDAGEGCWRLAVTTRRFAQHVAIDVPGFWPSASWFHLAPGQRRDVLLAPAGPPGDAVPSGEVRALNSVATAKLRAAG